MTPAACEIKIVHKTFNDYRRLQVITEHDYNYIKFGESVITIMIIQKMQSITIVISPTLVYGAGYIHV